MHLNSPPARVGIIATAARRTSFSFRSRYWIRSAMLTIWTRCRRENSIRSGMRAIVPWSFMVQLVELMLGHREADQAAPVLGHEVDRLGRDLLRCDAEIALVLAVGVVDQDHELAGADVRDGCLDGGDRGPDLLRVLGELELGL